MIFNWDSENFCWHIMIPVKTNKKFSGQHIIAACTDSSIIRKPAPASLNRHVDIVTEKSPNGVEHGYPYSDIELKYSKICPDCIKLYDPEKIKFELIVLKLKSNYIIQTTIK